MKYLNFIIDLTIYFTFFAFLQLEDVDLEGGSELKPKSRSNSSSGKSQDFFEGV